MPAAFGLARALPELRFVVDHLAKPGPSPAPARSLWMTRLAALPNVSVKLSGLVTEARWDAWSREDFEPQAEFALEAFGPERLLFGSDWPVCLLAASYGDVSELAGRLLARLDAESLRFVFGGNAARIYGVG